MEWRVTLGYMDQAPGEWDHGESVSNFYFEFVICPLVLGIWNAWMDFYKITFTLGLFILIPKLKI